MLDLEYQREIKFLVKERCGTGMTKESFIKSTITAAGTEISIITRPNEDDYISLTDIAKKRNPEFPGFVIQNWMRNRSTVDYLGLWERMNNPNFNYLEFEVIKQDAGNNSFVLTPKKWVQNTEAIGIVTKQGRYAATYAHRDIAFEFASWISPEFKLYIIMDYQRLKTGETQGLGIEWNVKRIMAKANYRIHTDAVKKFIIPEISKKQQSYVYADEADMLNVVLFGKTASEWRIDNPDKDGNMRDYASIEQLLVLVNIENLNAEFIAQGLSQAERIVKLRNIALAQLKQLTGLKSVEELKIIDGDTKKNSEQAIRF